MWSPLPSKVIVNKEDPIFKFAGMSSSLSNPTKKMIHLNIGDPTLGGQLGPCQVASEAVKEALESKKHSGYSPSVGGLAARQAVVDRFSTPEAPFCSDEVILTSGCAHALQLAIECIANPGDNILIPNPQFPLYKTLVEFANMQYRRYSLNLENGGLVDLGHLESLIDKRTRAILVNNPSNPLGTVFPKEHIQDILTMAEKHKLVIISDEIYGDMVYNDAVFHSFATLNPKVPMIVCDGISKRWMVPGWRVGWLIFHNRFNVLSEVYKRAVQSTQRTLGPCSLVEHALPKILKDTPNEYFVENRKLISSNADIMCSVLKDMPGVSIIKPNGAFYMMFKCDEKDYGPVPDFIEKLAKEESLWVLPGAMFGSPEWVRIHLTHSNEVMKEAAQRIRELCGRLYLEKKKDDTENRNYCAIN